ncbi:MAG: hypothetical protein V2A76_18975 [Planctomycetota bacterium]
MSRTIFTLLNLALVVAMSRAGDLMPLGSEFVVTSRTSNVQKQPWVACDDDGNFVLSYSQGDVYARLFDRDGNPLADDFLVNPTVNWGEQDETYVSVDPVSGDFVIVWSDRHGNDGDQMGIGGRFYAADGTPYGSEFILNTHTAASQFEPHASFSPSGRVFVVWTDAGTDGSAGAVGRIFTRYGTAVTGEILINEPSTFTQIDPSVSCDRAGNFVVAFVDASGATGDPREVLARRFDQNGVALGGQFLVNSISTGMQRDPIVAVNSNGEFVVVFQDESGTDGDGWGVFARLFDASGTALGAQFVTSNTTVGDQVDPHVSVDYPGNFIVSWVDAGGVDAEVMARRFDRFGDPLGNEFTVHAAGKLGDQSYQKFCVSQSGQRFIAVWFDNDSDDYARLFDLPMILPDPPLTLGTTSNLDLDLPGSGSDNYILLVSLSTSPGIPVTDSRMLDLTFDTLMLYGLTVPTGPVFTNLIGVLDGSGGATCQFIIPNNPTLSGANVSCAAVTNRTGIARQVEQLTDSLTLTIQ